MENKINDSDPMVNGCLETMVMLFFIFFYILPVVMWLLPAQVSVCPDCTLFQIYEYMFDFFSNKRIY